MQPPYIRNTYDTNPDATVDSHVRNLLSGTLPIQYSNGTGVISATLVGTYPGQPGVLSYADYLSFQGKQNALTIGNFTEATSSILTITGGTGAIIGSGLTVAVAQAGVATSGYLSTTDWNTFNGKQGALSFGNLTELTSSVLTIAGGTGAVIGSGATILVKQSSASQSGYLSSTDWGIFNGKQNALSFPLAATLGGTGQSTVTTGDLLYGSAANVWSKLADVATGSVLLSGGIGTAPAWGQVSLTAAITGVLPIANGGTNNAGPFTAGSVIFSNGTALTQDNSMFFWDDTNKAFCVGTVTQAAALTVVAQTAGQAGCNITAANRGAVAGAGGGFLFTGGSGGSPATGVGGLGGLFTVTLATGGTSTNSTGGVGGGFSVAAGAGGVSGSHFAGPAGGGIGLASGVGGTNSVTTVSGNGGAFILSSGAGGPSSSSGAAGQGGPFSLGGGNGGVNSSTGNGGKGGAFNLSGGGGGSALAGTPGAGGSITLNAGSAGTATTLGNVGGSIFLNPGQGTAGSANGLIVLGALTTDLVNFIAGSGAAAPATNVGVAIVNYYGTSAMNFLGTPRAWLSIQAAGAPFLIPLY